MDVFKTVLQKILQSYLGFGRGDFFHPFQGLSLASGGEGFLGDPKIYSQDIWKTEGAITTLPRKLTVFVAENQWLENSSFLLGPGPFLGDICSFSGVYLSETPRSGVFCSPSEPSAAAHEKRRTLTSRATANGTAAPGSVPRNATCKRQTW